jgi:paraquat-inducible protein B
MDGNQERGQPKEDRGKIIYDGSQDGCQPGDYMKAMLNSIINVIQERTKAMIKADQEQIRAKLKAGQEKMEAAMNSTQSELEGTNNNCVEDILASVVQWNQCPHKESSAEIADTKQDLHEEFNLRI